MMILGENPIAISFVKKVSKMLTKAVNMARIIKNLISMDSAKAPLFLDLAKEGKKLWVKAPSAKILLKRFGNLKAIKNISLYMFAPSIEAVNRSLMSPKILDVRIPALFVKIDFKNIQLLIVFI